MIEVRSVIKIRFLKVKFKNMTSEKEEIDQEAASEEAVGVTEGASEEVTVEEKLEATEETIEETIEGTIEVVIDVEVVADMIDLVLKAEDNTKEDMIELKEDQEKNMK